ncbi:Retrovirus-related Pol polyprotein from type-2 retrotransposable element R2DM [Trichinella papuae]|uniref:Retrovirus-related Pol polyprotein from type-2 retrotransposable element R2DM n=1 Tax=Trichinella papuae TaxID=268474 RepID=A0A0V1M7U1_9BILA|nr:Retrovirus-related Pol polyprotein from type-2 retrotransposable element R2DM [Trichinella papuae]
MRLHMKRALPSFFSSLQPPVKAPRWSALESNTLRELEDALRQNGELSNEKLAWLMTDRFERVFTINMVKGHRRKFRETPRTGGEDSRSSITRESTPALTAQTPPSTIPVNAITSDNPETAENINKKLKQHLLHCTTTHNTEVEAEINDIIRDHIIKGNNKNYVTRITKHLIGAMRPEEERRPKTGRKKKKPEPSVPLNSKQRKRMAYRKVQQAYHKDPKRVVAHLFHSQPLENVSCPVESGEKALQARLGKRPPADRAPFLPKRAPLKNHLLSPISVKEVSEHLKQMNLGSASGPDGVKVSHLRDIGPQCLSKIFNTFLLERHIPQVLKDCRTTLIPKVDNPRPDAEDFRPITIGSCIYRLFSKIVTSRLSQLTPLNPRQKAFRSGTDGAFDNITTVASLLKLARKTGKEINLACIDLAKAFDTVNHTSITRALHRHGVDSASIELVESMVGEATTVIINSDGTRSNVIKFNRGVRQGDPISPLLFNLVLDELIDNLDQARCGFSITKEIQVSCVAFADDITLVSGSREGMNNLLTITREFLGERGLGINHSKCKGIRFTKVPKSKSLIIDTNPNCFLIRNQQGTPEPIPMAKPGEPLKTLGINLTLEGNPTFNYPELTRILNTIKHAPLKPHQKVQIIRDHLIPLLQYKLGVPTFYRATLNNIDKSIRLTVKEILHLPTTGLHNSYLYLPLKEGGLGLKRLATQYASRVGLGLSNMATSDDAVSRAVAGLHLSLMDKAKNCLGLSEISKEAIKKAKEKLVQAEIRTLLQCHLGRSHSSFTNDTISNSWMRYPTFLSARNYIMGIKLRAGIIETRAQKWRGRSPPHPTMLLCRHCGARSRTRETDIHVSQKCLHNKKLILRRHNCVVSTLGRRATQQGFAVYYEPCIKHGETVLKPDLVIIKGDTATIIDVAVPWEQGTNLREHNSRKISKYQCLEREAAKYFNVKTVKTGSLVVGARGKWSAGNDSTLKSCGLHCSKRLKKLLCTIALEGTCAVFKH